MAICGIDLGTTFSAIAYYEKAAGKVELIPDQDTSNPLVPSAVYYPEDGEPIVGEAALNMGAQNPDRLVQWIKMSMGTNYTKQIGDKNYTPEEVSAEILKKLKRNAEMELGEEVEAVVITVPAYFGDAERFATKKAAELAGLNCKRLLAEPSAAALAYVIESKADLLSGKKNVLVSDLGGGTYDVTLLQTEPKTTSDGNPTLNIQILCKDGSRELGGKLWDDRLEEFVVEQCIELGHTEDPKSDPLLALTLHENIIKTKELLTNLEKAQIICDPGHKQEVTREQFEETTSGLMMEVEQKIRSVLDMAKLVLLTDEEKENNEMKENGLTEEETLNRIDPILIVGGSSRMPMVKKRIEEITGKVPQIHKSVDLLVAFGAAYDVCIDEEGIEIQTKSGIIINQKPTDIGKAVGVKALDERKAEDVNAIVIKEGKPLGEEFRREDLAIAFDNQKAIQFDIYEGNSEDISACILLGSVMLDLPVNQPKGTRVEVILKYDDDGIIVGKGICYTTEGKKDVPIRIDRNKITVS